VSFVSVKKSAAAVFNQEFNEKNEFEDGTASFL